MKKFAAAAALVLLAACRRHEVPVGQFLLRVDGPWVTPQQAAGRNIRTAPATVVVFRNENEYFELHCRLIEQPDSTLYVSSDHPHASALGRWIQHGDSVRAVRMKVSRHEAAAILCQPITFHLTGNVVSGNAGGNGEGTYSPVTRLVAPDYRYYIKEAQESHVSCAEVKE